MAAGFVTAYVYDNRDRLIEQDDPAANVGGAPLVSTFTYDGG